MNICLASGLCLELKLTRQIRRHICIQCTNHVQDIWSSIISYMHERDEIEEHGLVARTFGDLKSCYCDRRVAFTASSALLCAYIYHKRQQKCFQSIHYFCKNTCYNLYNFLSLDAAEAVLVDSTRGTKGLYRMRLIVVVAAASNRPDLLGLNRHLPRLCSTTRYAIDPSQCKPNLSLSRCKHLSELLEQLWRGALSGAVHEVEVCNVSVSGILS